jgi:hypothetical protein
MNEQWLGLITGVCFGVLLQQGRVLRFEKQVGAMLLKDMTIMKFMMSIFWRPWKSSSSTPRRPCWAH